MKLAKATGLIYLDLAVPIACHESNWTLDRSSLATRCDPCSVRQSASSSIHGAKARILTNRSSQDSPAMFMPPERCGRARST
jgi:hypothetical protein